MVGITPSPETGGVGRRCRAGLRQIRPGIAKAGSPRLGRCQGGPRPLPDHFPLMLGHGRQHVHGELVGVGVANRNHRRLCPRSLQRV